MRKILILIPLCALLTVFSCSKDKADDGAVRAAKEYYDSLVAGNSSCFVRGMYLPDTVPDAYREQLEDNAKMFMGRMAEEHHGVYEVRMANCVNDTLTFDGGKTSVRTVNAFLVLCFGDSLNEEIVVPMIEHKGRWLMR